MFRTKNENISMKYIVVLTLCLCYGLVMSLLITSAYAARRPQQPYYVVDVYQTPGKVFRIIHGQPSVFFQRLSGNISSIALCNRELFFCSTKDNRIYQKMGSEERVVFEHNTFIRDITVDPNGNLYFSEAKDAKGNGTIYRLTPSVNQIGDGTFYLQSNQPFYTVNLEDVDGFWAGDCTFDLQGNIYLSSGYCTPAFIYRLEKKEGNKYGPPLKIYKDSESAIKGITMEPNNTDFVYYTDWRQTIYKVNLRYLKQSIEYSENIARSRNPHLSDVAFDMSIQN